MNQFVILGIHWCLMTLKNWTCYDYFMWFYGNGSYILKSIPEFMCTNECCYLYHSGNIQILTCGNLGVKITGNPVIDGPSSLNSSSSQLLWDPIISQSFHDSYTFLELVHLFHVSSTQFQRNLSVARITSILSELHLSF